MDQMTALTTVFANLAATRDLKRKIERLSMENEDIRRSTWSTVSKMTWKRRSYVLHRECERLQQERTDYREVQELRMEILALKQEKHALAEQLGH